MKKFLFVCLFVMMTGSALAQELAKNAPPKVEKKEAPSTAIIPADTVRIIEGARKDNQLINLQIENLQLKIAQANAEIDKLKGEAKKAEDAMSAAIGNAATAAKIPRDELGNYDLSTAPDGAWILKKKVAPVVTPPKP